jgi:nucleoside-diphosphate-sugar epimerase
MHDTLTCVTGGAGFIGSHIVEALLVLGARVRVIDDLSNGDEAWITSRVADAGGKLEFVHGSILEPAAVADAVRDARMVFHLAAIGSVPRSIEQPARTFAVNATGTCRVAEAARAAGVRRLVYAASSSAYGDTERMPLNEGMPPRPLSPYAASKLAGEHIVRGWTQSMGLPGLSLRYFNVFGPRQPAGSAYAAVIPAFIERLSRGDRPIIFGDGSASRDFCFIDNVVLANMLAATAPTAAGDVFNIACGESTSVLELARMLGELTGHADVQPAFEPPRQGDPPRSLADLSRSRDVLGYKCLVRVREGLERTVETWGAAARNGAEHATG